MAKTKHVKQAYNVSGRRASSAPVTETLPPDMEGADAQERDISKTGVHWIVYVKALIVFALFAVPAFYLNALAAPRFYPAFTVISWILYGLGVILIVPMLIYVLTTELRLTTRRILFKTGLIFQKLIEIDLKDYEGATCTRSIIGRLLHFGDIHFSTDINTFTFKSIPWPMQFLDRCEKCRSGRLIYYRD